MKWDLYYFARAFALIIFVVFVLSLFALLFSEWYNVSVREFVITHFTVTVVIPVAVIIAFGIVAIFESTAGQIKFAVGPLKVEGAAGPIIMWVLCFLAITTSVKILW